MRVPMVIRAWALMSETTKYRSHRLPIVFQTRHDAESHRDPDERLYRVTVTIEREVKPKMPACGATRK